MLFARRVNRFNPRNKEVMAVTYYNEAVFLLNYNRKDAGRVEPGEGVFQDRGRVREGFARREKSIDEGLRNVEALIK